MFEVENQIQRIFAYANFDPSKVYANCEECGIKIPIELTLCDNCKEEKEITK